MRGRLAFILVLLGLFSLSPVLAACVSCDYNTGICRTTGRCDTSCYKFPSQSGTCSGIYPNYCAASGAYCDNYCQLINCPTYDCTQESCPGGSTCTYCILAGWSKSTCSDAIQTILKVERVLQIPVKLFAVQTPDVMNLLKEPHSQPVQLAEPAMR
jgi:hypothetical protein